jgi:arginine decarboxylase
MSDTVDIVWGRGDAGTPLSAFDAALAAAGIHNYNLVTYSSIIPPDRTIRRPGRVAAEHGVGTPVGVVLAGSETAESAGTVAAGLGWILADEGGVMMESTASSASAVRSDLKAMLADARERRDWNWEAGEHLVVREHAVERPDDADRVGAVVVAAVYGPLAYADERG